MSLAALQIQIEALDRASKPIQKIADEIERLESTADSITKVGQGITSIGQGLTATVTAPIAAGLGLAGKAAIDFEASLAGAAKTLGTTEVETAALGDELLKLTRTIPTSATGLAEIAAAGGQLGIASEDIAGFVETTAKMGIAFDMSAAMAGDAVAKLMNVYSLNLDAATSMGDAINAVSNSSAASASAIVEAAARSGGAARQFGLTETQAVALNGAIIALGRPAEVTATALSSMLPVLQTASGQMPKFQEGLEMAGLSATQLEQAIQQDAMGGLTMFIDALGQMEAQQRALAIQNMFGSGSDAAILAQLAADSSGLTKNLELLGEATNFAGSMQAEFESQAGTTANQMELFKNAAMEAGISLGNVLLPAITDVLNAVTPMIQRFAEFAQNNPEIARTGVIIAGIAAAVGPALMAIGMMAQGIGAVIAFAAKLKLIFLAVSAVAAGPILIGLAAVAAFGALIAANWEHVAPAFQRVWGAVQNLLAAFAPMLPAAQQTAAAWGGIAQVILRLVQVGIAALGRLVVAMINNSSRVVSTVINMGARIVSAIAGIGNQVFSAGAQIIGRLAEGMLSSIGRVVGAAKSVASAVMSVLPNSPVPTGPLTALNNIAHNPGAKIVDMLSAGIMSQAGQLGSTLGGALSPAASPVGLLASGNTGTQSAPASSSGNVFNITLNVSEDAAEQGIDALEQRIDELMARYGARQERLSFG